MNQRKCPVCNSNATHSKNFIDENIDSKKITTYTFSSRKEPEWMCYKLIKCYTCELVYAPSPPSVEELSSAYHQAHFDSSEEANDAAFVYFREIENILKTLPEKKIALEIGCGSGIFLEHLKKYGFEKLVGIEPSIAAIQTAPSQRQEWIRHGIFENIELNSESFDLICCFMTLEHVQSPTSLAQSAYQLLKKGGAFVIVTHDYNSLINKLLGRRSPIIDIEHLQLFTKKSINIMLHESGFRNISIKKFNNYYSLKYWLRLAPLPKIFKKFMQLILHRTNLQSVKLRLNVGNIISVGYKT